MSPTIYWILLGVLGSVFLVLLVTLVRNSVVARRSWGEFMAETDGLGLGDEEMRVLGHMARALPSGRPTSLLHNSELFNQAQKLIEADRTFRKLPPSLQDDARSTLDRLRSKLGFPLPGAADTAPTTSRQLTAGTYLSLCPGPGISPVEVLLAENTPQTLVTEPISGLESEELEQGQALTVLFSHEGTYWQFPAVVQAVANGDIYVSHSEEMRKADRRRYQRIPTNLRAKVAGFQFVHEASETEGPEFHDARLLEIAGPGLLLQTELGVNAGQKILVSVCLSKQRTVEAMGIVRRVSPNHQEGGNNIGVELVGLTGPELAIMIQETTNAKQEQQMLNARRRRYTRAPVNSQARISCMGAGKSEFFEAQLTEISAAGIRVVTELQCQPEQKVAILIELPGGQNVEATGIVRRVDSDQGATPELAIELTGVTGRDLAAMINETDQALQDA